MRLSADAWSLVAAGCAGALLWLLRARVAAAVSALVFACLATIWIASALVVLLVAFVAVLVSGADAGPTEWED